MPIYAIRVQETCITEYVFHLEADSVENARKYIEPWLDDDPLGFFDQADLDLQDSGVELLLIEEDEGGRVRSFLKAEEEPEWKD